MKRSEPDNYPLVEQLIDMLTILRGEREWTNFRTGQFFSGKLRTQNNECPVCAMCNLLGFYGKLTEQAYTALQYMVGRFDGDTTTDVVIPKEYYNAVDEIVRAADVVDSPYRAHLMFALEIA